MAAKTRFWPGPWLSLGDHTGAKDEIVLRLYLSAFGNLNMVRSPHSGDGVATSSAYDRTQDVAFEYGGVLVVEPWNASRNRPWAKLANPQIHLGLVFPKEPVGRHFWEDFSLVAGVGLRAPLESGPASSLEVQLGPVLWIELSQGERNTHYAVLFGVNLMLGSLLD